jgi:hypothetical protein
MAAAAAVNPSRGPQTEHRLRMVALQVETVWEATAFSNSNMRAAAAA